MKKLIPFLFLATPVIAEENIKPFYFGIDIAGATYGEQGVDDRATMGTAYGRLGYQINEFIATEIRAGFGLSSDNVDVFGIDASVDLDYMYGAYVVTGVNVYDTVYPYVVFGITRGEITGTAQIGQITFSETDASFGIGVEWLTFENVSINM